MLWIRWIAFTLMIPGTITVLVPWLILSRAGTGAMLTTASLAGVPLMALGIFIYGWCSREFISRGRGTPAPYDPPKKLVVSGLYRYTRNPMYVGIVSLLIGEALAFRSIALGVYSAIIWLLFHLRVIFYEEPKLRELFGQEYLDYCAEVKRWMPRF
jgi:protein-S-isoprenylcysteine O-methyltransferase Ste14